MTSPILLTGGTGTLGRLVVRRLRDHSCDVRVLSRSSRESRDSIEFMTGDLGTGEGIQAAVDRAGPATGQGRPRVPGRRQPGSGTGCGTPDLGGVLSGPDGA